MHVHHCGTGELHARAQDAANLGAKRVEDDAKRQVGGVVSWRGLRVLGSRREAAHSSAGAGEGSANCSESEDEGKERRLPAAVLPFATGAIPAEHLCQCCPTKHHPRSEEDVHAGDEEEDDSSADRVGNGLNPAGGGGAGEAHPRRTRLPQVRRRHEGGTRAHGGDPTIEVMNARKIGCCPPRLYIRQSAMSRASKSRPSGFGEPTHAPGVGGEDPGVIVIKGAHPRLYSHDLAPTSEAGRTWGTFSLFAMWMSDVHSVGGYTFAASLFFLGLPGCRKRRAPTEPHPPQPKPPPRCMRESPSTMHQSQVAAAAGDVRRHRHC